MTTRPTPIIGEAGEPIPVGPPGDDFGQPGPVTAPRPPPEGGTPIGEPPLPSPAPPPEPGTPPAPSPSPGTPSPPPSGGGGGGGQSERQRLLEQVRLTLPWLPFPMRRVYVDAWIDTGDPHLALAMMRDHPLYDRYFAGNKREDGTLRFSEQNYQRQVEHYQQTFTSLGLNPTFFHRGIGQLIAGEVSGAEFDARIRAFRDRVQMQAPAIRQAMASLYPGLRMTDAAILASLLDPEISRAIIDRRISVAEVGASAIEQGFALNDPALDLEGIERLVQAGVSRNGARELFALAGQQLPTLDRLAERHFDPDDTFDLGEFLEAGVFGSSEQTQRIRRLLDAESSLFTAGNVAQGRLGQLTGLTAR